MLGAGHGWASLGVPGPGSLLTQSRRHLAFQEQVTAAVAHALEQQMQKLLEETQAQLLCIFPHSPATRASAREVAVCLKV